MLGIFAVIGTAANASLIYVLTNILGQSALIAGYLSSGMSGFLIYMMSAYLTGYEKAPEKKD